MLPDILTNIAASLTENTIQSHMFEVAGSALSGAGIAAMLLEGYKGIKARWQSLTGNESAKAAVAFGKEILAAVEDGQFTGQEVSDIWNAGLHLKKQVGQSKTGLNFTLGK